MLINIFAMLDILIVYSFGYVLVRYIYLEEKRQFLFVFLKMFKYFYHLIYLPFPLFYGNGD